MKATKVTLAPEVAKTVKRCDVVALNRTIKPIVEQNRKELRDSWEEVKNQYTGN